MYKDILRKTKDIYNSPVHYLNEIQNSYTQEKNSYTNRITLKIKSKKFKKNKPLIYFNIKQSRAEISYNLSELIFDDTALYSCHPKDIIELGCYSKEYEIYQLFKTHKKSSHVYTTGLIKKLKKFIPKARCTPPPELPFDAHKLYVQNNGELCIKMVVSSAKTTFNIPFYEFILDEYLIFNTKPSSLIKIGYLASEITNQFSISSILGSYQ